MKIELKRQAAPYVFTFTEDADVVNEMVKKSFEAQKSKFVVKGFRKGTASRKIVEAQQGRFVMYREIFDELFLKAIEEEDINVVESKAFSVIGPFEDDQPLTIRSTVYLYPQVKIELPEDFKVEKNVTVVDDDFVDHQIELRCSAAAQFTNVVDTNYVIKDGDAVLIDFAGKCEGKEFNGGSAKNFKYTFGETNFIPGFEDQMRDMKLNDIKIVKVTFPEQYQTKELQNKDAEFDVTLKKIFEKNLKSVLELAKEEDKDVDTFKADLKVSMTTEQKENDDDKYRALILQKCIDIADIDPIPETILENEIDNEWIQLLNRIDKTEEEYLKMTNKNAKELFYSQQSSRAESTIRSKIILDELSKDIEINDEEAVEFMVERSRKLNKSEEDIEKMKVSIQRPHNINAIKRNIKHEKILNSIIEKQV